MQVKKYTAPNMQDAIRMIKEDLGSRAVIISTRKIRKGSGAFGMFGKPVLEVTAARDQAGNNAYTDTSSELALPSLQKTEYEKELVDNPPAYPRRIEKTNEREMYNHLKNDITELKELVTDLRQGFRREVNDQASVSHLKYEISELKHLVNTMMSHSGRLRDDDLHENLIALYQQLCFNGVESKFARRLMEEVKKKLPPEEIGNFSYVKIYVARMFMQVLKVNPAPTRVIEGKGPRILSFLGPTGVGKTTTLAKIAGSEKIAHPDIKIGMITLDTFRIAAVQQLQEYAKIINVPLKVVNDKEQLSNTLKEFQNKDLILIDSAGRSQRDEVQMGELRSILKDFKQISNLLVLSATTKDNDLVEVTKRFSRVPLDGIVFTKLDESTSYGSIFNHAIRFKLPLTYLTTGQNVPDDIENASRDRLIDLLLNISAMDG